MKSWAIESRQAGVKPKLFDVPEPVLGPTSLLVKVKGASVNPADIKVMSGKNGGPFLHDAKFPIRLGFDYSGIVTQVGTAVSDVVVGQEVFGFLAFASKTTQGAFSERITVEFSQSARKPSKATHAEAAALATVASTALRCLRNLGKLKAGQKVLINGASGGVGGQAVQIAKILGVEVCALAGKKNLDYVRALGADKVMDYNATKIGELSEKFDVIFDVASNLSFSTCAKVMTPNGVYITLLPTPAFLMGFFKSFFSMKACRFYAAKSKKEDLELIAQWMDEGRLKPCVEKFLSFDEVPEALELLNRPNPRGKIALRF